MESVARTADRLMIINEGKLVAIDTPKNIFSSGELLAEADLCMPTTIKFLNILKNHLPDLQTNVFSAEQALHAILTAYLQASATEEKNV